MVVRILDATMLVRLNNYIMRLNMLCFNVLSYDINFKRLLWNDFDMDTHQNEHVVN